MGFRVAQALTIRYLTDLITPPNKLKKQYAIEKSMK